jgi:hypothetical protein
MFNLPDDEPEARIQAGIAQDPDAPELTDQELPHCVRSGDRRPR